MSPSAIVGVMQSFRGLLVWHKAHALALNVRRATRWLPRVGYQSLRSQTVSSAESVVCNIVEGCGASTRKEFARFLDIGIKSTCELEYQLQLAADCGVLPQRTLKSLSAETVEVRRMLCGLRRALRETDRRN